MLRHLTGSVPPDLVLCSSARRARDTLDGIRPALPDGVEVLIEDDLYDASSSSLVDRVRQLDEAIASVMLVGHNPGLHDLAVELVGDDRDHDDATGWEQLVTKFPTGAIATVSFRARWADVQPGCAELVDFFTPRPPR